MEQIRRRTLVGLNEVALKQFNQWERTQQEISQIQLNPKIFGKGKSLQRLIYDLKLELRPYQPGDYSHTRKKNGKRHQHDPSVAKVSVNRHFRHSKR